MTPSSATSNLNLQATQDLLVKTWAKVLIAQHVQLKSEMNNITARLSQGSLCIFQLDAKLRRLIKGVKIHLQLENEFFIPVLWQINITLDQKNKLTEGFGVLFETCESTVRLINSLKISLSHAPLKKSHIQEIECMFDDIRVRLADEDIVYSMIDTLEEQYV